MLRAVLGQALMLAFPGVPLCTVLLCVYEVSMLLRYFEPDSSPALLSDAEVEGAVQKMFGLVETTSCWLGFTSSIICCALLKTTLTATDSIHQCNRMPRQSTVIHREESFLLCAGNAMDAKFCKGRVVYINAWRKITTDPVENNHLAARDATSLVALDDYFASDLFMPRVFFRLRQYGLRDHIAVKHRWYYFLKMQMDAVLLSKQLDSDTVFAGCMTFHTAFVDPIARPDVPERESIECPRLSVLP